MLTRSSFHHPLCRLRTESLCSLCRTRGTLCCLCPRTRTRTWPGSRCSCPAKATRTTTGAHPRETSTISRVEISSLDQPAAACVAAWLGRRRGGLPAREAGHAAGRRTRSGERARTLSSLLLSIMTHTYLKHALARSDPKSTDVGLESGRARAQPDNSGHARHTGQRRRDGTQRGTTLDANQPGW